MKEQIKVLSVTLIILVLIAATVYAAGSGTGGSSSSGESSGGTRTRTISSNTTGNDTDAQNRDNRTQNRTRGDYVYQERDCEAFNTTLERIRCRIIQGENYTSPRDSVEEACRVLDANNKGRCMAFYATIQTCFKLEGRAKDACFKRASGFTKARLNEENSTQRPEKARDYMVALLYHLQERVEKAHEKGRISADDASALINKIVEIKQEILSGAKKEEIRPMVRELKEMWRAAKPNIEDNEDS